MFLRIAAIVLILALPVWATHTCGIGVGGGKCYISSVGNDANSGADAANAWAHLPGSAAVAGNASTQVPQAGDQYILRGGDTWDATNFQINWTWSGTALSPIYIGVDQTWYSGGSWTRPIFDCGLIATCATAAYRGTMLVLAGSNLILDNIEFKGLYVGASAPGEQHMIFMQNQNIEVKNCYLHGWNHVGTKANTTAPYNNFILIDTYLGGGGAAVSGTLIHDNVIDGVDTQQDMAVGIGSAEQIYRNVVRYVLATINGDWNSLHDNFTEHNVTGYCNPTIGCTPAQQPHCNGIYQHALLYGNKSLWYNNVVTNSNGNGCPISWVLGANNSACTGQACVTYAFNNVVSNIGSDQGGIAFAGHSSDGCDVGTLYAYNNTLENGALKPMGNGETSVAPCTPGSPRGTVKYANDHGISSAAGLCDNTGVTCTDDDAGKLLQTSAVASADGYSLTTAFNYQPTSGSGGTVGTGLAGNSATITNAYNAIVAISADAGAAFLKDTTYGCSLNATNHTAVCPARTPLTRPAAAAWDIGAYQYSAVPPPPGGKFIFAPGTSVIAKPGTGIVISP